MLRRSFRDGAVEVTIGAEPIENGDLTVSLTSVRTLKNGRVQNKRHFSLRALIGDVTFVGFAGYGRESHYRLRGHLSALLSWRYLRVLERADTYRTGIACTDEALCRLV